MRPRGFALLATRRLRSDRAVALLAWLLLLTAVALPATGVLYADRVSLAGLRTSFLAASPAERSVRVGIDAPLAEVDTVDAAVSAAVGSAIAAAAPDLPAQPNDGPPSLPAGVLRTARSGEFAAEGSIAGDLVAIGSFDQLGAHAALVNGSWARAGQTPIEATLSTGAATGLGVRVGDLVSLRPSGAGGGSGGSGGSGASIALRVTGTWRPDASDPYWEADPLDLAGAQTVRLTTRGPFAVARSDLATVLAGAAVHAEWRGLPDAGHLSATSADALRAGTGALAGRVQAIVGTDRAVTLNTQLPDLLARLAQAGLVGRQVILLLVAQLGVLALYALLLVGGIVAGRRRREDALLSERGATGPHLAGAAVVEGLLLGLPAAVAAIPLAGFAADWLVAVTAGAAPALPSGPDGSTVLVAVAAALIGALALAAPSVQAGASLLAFRTAVGRRVGRTLNQRVGLDLVLVVLTIIAIWQLRSYGTTSAGASGAQGGASGSGGRSVDLVLVLTPAIGLLAGAALVLRLLPRLAELLERGMARLPGLVPSAGAREIARLPQRWTRVALLVVLAAGLGTLAATHAATWLQSRHDASAYAVPSDLRAVAGPSGSLPGWLSGPALRAVAGVTGALPVVNRKIDTGAAVGAQLLAIDVDDAIALGARPGAPASLAAAGPLLAGLAVGLPADGGVAIPDGTRRLRVQVDAGLIPGPDTPDAPLSGVDVRLLLRDDSGHITWIAAGTAMPFGTTALDVALARAIDGAGGNIVAPGPGLRLLGAELAIPTPPGVTASGRVDLLGIAAATGDAPADGPWTDLAVATPASAWTWTRVEDSTVIPYQAPAAAWGRLVLGAGNGPGGAAGGSTLPTRFELAPARSATVGPGATVGGSGTSPAQPPVPILVNDAFLSRTGAAVGDTFDGAMIGDGVRVRVAGTLDLFPPLDPARAFMVVDRRWFELARRASGGDPVDPDEWWLTTAAGTDANAVAATLESAPYQARSVVTRVASDATATGDPISLGIIGALALGAFAALIFSTLGYVVHAAVTTRDRVRELALMRALGTSGREALGWLWVEHASILAVSLLAGLALGLVLAWLIVPTATLTADGRPPVPAPDLSVPLAFVAGLVAVALALLGVTLAIVSRLAGRLDVAALLRETGG